MGLFNVIKGAYPSLQQIDRTLPVAAKWPAPNQTVDQSGIVRGSAIFEDAGNFRLALAANAGSVAQGVVTPGVYVYFCLMDQTDLVASMAGTIGQGVGGGTSKVTGLACSMPMECETDQFVGSPAIGSFLTLAGTAMNADGNGGKLQALDAGTGATAYGQVTQGVTTRWANDAVAVAGWRTGNKVNVIRFRAMYIPGLVIA